MKIIFVFLMSVLSVLSLSQKNKTLNITSSDFDKATYKRVIAQYDSSIYYFNKILEKKFLQNTTKAKILLERGKSYQLKQEYDKTLLDYNASLKIYTKYKDRNGIAKSYIYLAEYNRHLGKLKLANNLINEVDSYIQNYDIDKRIIALFYNRKAAIFSEYGGTPVQIFDYSKKSIELSKKLGLKNIEASSYNEIGWRYYDTHDTLAIFYYKKSLKLYKELGDVRSQSHVIVNIARFYQITEQFEKSLIYCDLGIDLIKDTDWYLDLKELYHLKSTCFYFLGRFEEAFEISAERMNTAVQYIHSLNKKNLIEIETKYEVDKKNEQIKIQQLKAEQAQIKAKERLNQIKYTIIVIILLALFLMLSVYAFFKIRKSNKQLNQSIEQKEILLQEVHHRVKNNLTVLNSLLYIQADESNDKETKRILKECQGRIQSMALVHQNLYDVDDASEVNLNSFLEQLIYESQEIFGNQNLKISKKIETNAIHFGMSFTVFLGLILNELITNSFKYAFSDNGENKMKIELKKEENKFVLTYSDSGRGLPNYFDFKKSSGFGFKLIQIMINQIRGSLDYSKKNNSFTIQFKKN